MTAWYLRLDAIIVSPIGQQTFMWLKYDHIIIKFEKNLLLKEKRELA